MFNNIQLWVCDLVMQLALFANLNLKKKFPVSLSKNVEISVRVEFMKCVHLHKRDRFLQ